MKLSQIEKELNSYYLEKESEIHCLSLALLSNSHILILGSPGIAKTAISESWAKSIKGAKYFSWLMGKFTTPEELAGPYSLSAIKEDRFKRNTSGKLPEAHVACLDEIFKSNSSILNFLLGILNERKFHNDGIPSDVPLISLVGLSNELPDSSDNLDALLDRFQLKIVSTPIQESSNFKKMLSGADAFIPNTLVSLEEIKEYQKEVENIIFTDENADTLIKIKLGLYTNGIHPTDRTFKKCIKILKAEAFMSGRTIIEPQDFEILKHVLWIEESSIKKVYSIILDNILPEKNQILTWYEAAFVVYQDFKKLNDMEQKAKNAPEVIAKLKESKKNIHGMVELLKSAKKFISPDILHLEEILDTYANNIYSEVYSIHGL